MRSAPFQRTLIAGAIASSLAMVPSEKASADFPVPSGYYLRLEGGLTQVGGDETTFAEVVALPGTRVGDLRLDSDNGWSGRAEIGARFGDAWDTGVRYSRLKSDGKEASGVYGTPTYAYPVLGTATTFYNTATAKAEVSYHVVDFEAGHHIKLGDADVRLSAGLRYADFDQSVTTEFVFPPGGATFVAMDEHEVEYRGIGPRLSVTLSVPVTRSGLRVGGAVGGAVLAGRIDRLTQQMGNAGFVGANTVKRDKFRTAYNLDAEFSVSYHWIIRHDDALDVSAGYRGEVWYGVYDNRNGVSPTGTQYGSSTANQRFHGPFFRLTYSF